MAVEMVDVYNQETGQKTRLPKTAVKHWEKRGYKTTPSQENRDKQKGN